jgi:poly-gamma-glutamate synthesis protein (capsule biosynthesis protein)
MKKGFSLLALGIFLCGLGVFGYFHLLANNPKSDNIQGEVAKPIKTLGREEVEKVNLEENTIVAAGDVMLSRHVGTKIREAGNVNLPFLKTKDILASGDITFVNLEAPFYDKGEPVTEGMIFKAEPETIEGLIFSGIDVVSLANNHIKNKGQAGMLYTFDHLTESGIKYAGAGKNDDEAHQAAVLEKKGLKFAFLAYTVSDGAKENSDEDTSNPDVAFLDKEKAKEDIKKTKENSDVVIVSMHAGAEYVFDPGQKQIDFARAVIDSGASLVLGHHPHVVQKVEQYKDGFIIYSLGNLVFDQMWSEETREGVIAKCKFEGKFLKKVEFIPTKIENYNQPRVAETFEEEKILKRMGLESPIVNL